MKKHLLIILTAMTLSSCYTTSYFVEGNYPLKSTVANHEMNNVTSNDGMYSDEFVTIMANISDPKIDLAIANNHRSSIRVLWDNAAFIDMNGSAHRVIHMGVKLVDKEKAQVPSVIPVGSNISDVVCPVDCIERINGTWEFSLFGSASFGSKDSAKQLVAKYTSNPQLTETKLLLPIEVDDKKIEYTLSFIGNKFQIKKAEVQDVGKTALATCGWTLGTSLLVYIIAMAAL